MTPEACRDRRAALAAAALDRLDAAEAIALRAHLDGCGPCRAEAADLRGVAGALGRAGFPDGPPAEPPRTLERDLLSRLGAARADDRRARRHRWASVAAAVAAALAVVAGVVASLGDDGSAGGRRVGFPVRPDGVEASAVVHARDFGTEIELDVSGLDAGRWYWLWLTGDDGERVTAGTFRGTGGDVDVSMSAAIPLRDARRVWVTDDGDAIVLDATLSDPAG